MRATILRQCEQAQLAVNNVGQTLRGSGVDRPGAGHRGLRITMPLLQTVRNELPR
ncbi:nitrogen assimilation transcriptional regulator [Klebsiella pneumoniae]|uniref:Nitrogen assimilation transcriptional regulator n=1 Tax=Klebsiella pneumoniae TaxID=573 RepID=A0A2X3GS17_KLEPN|nr:nitrogen assimilation transcriptional regulator [Klebsiella pneumoniae]